MLGLGLHGIVLHSGVQTVSKIHIVCKITNVIQPVFCSRTMHYYLCKSVFEKCCTDISEGFKITYVVILRVNVLNLNFDNFSKVFL